MPQTLNYVNFLNEVYLSFFVERFWGFAPNPKAQRNGIGWESVVFIPHHLPVGSTAPKICQGVKCTTKLPLDKFSARCFLGAGDEE